MLPDSMRFPELMLLPVPLQIWRALFPILLEGDIRPHLYGAEVVSGEQLEFAATDGHRLVVLNVGGLDVPEGRYFVHGDEMRRLSELDDYYCKHWSARAEVTTSPEFPDWREMIAGKFGPGSISEFGVRTPVLDTLRQVEEGLGRQARVWHVEVQKDALSAIRCTAALGLSVWLKPVPVTATIYLMPARLD